MKMPGPTLFAGVVSLLVLGAGCSTRQPAMSAREGYEAAVARSATVRHSDSPETLPAAAGLEDLLVYAAGHNARIEAAFYRWRTSLEKIPRAYGLPDPRLSYTYYLEHVETRVGPQRHALSITQTFPWFGRRDLAGDVALGEADVLLERLRAVEQRVFYDVRTAFFEYGFVMRSRGIIGETLEIAEAIEDLARRKYASGAASYADILRAQMKIDRLNDRLAGVIDQREPAAADLNAALDRERGAFLPEAAALPDEEPMLTDDEYREMLARANPELAALAAAAVRERRSIDLAKKEGMPNITVGVNYIETGAASMPNVDDSGRDAVMGMVAVNIPLWREKYRAGVRECARPNTVTPPPAWNGRPGKQTSGQNWSGPCTGIATPNAGWPSTGIH